MDSGESQVARIRRQHAWVLVVYSAFWALLAYPVIVTVGLGQWLVFIGLGWLVVFLAYRRQLREIRSEERPDPH